MRIIDADALKEKSYWECYSDPDDDYEYVLVADIDRAPTIDAVEVVRCKDCVRWNTIFDRTKAEYGLCQIRSQLEATKNDDFCSKGERRTDERLDLQAGCD